MSQLLRQLLRETDPLFSHSLARLEHASGSQSIDVKLTADILSATRLKIEALGLDPHDTTARELYASLRAQAIDADGALQAHLGHPSNADDATQKTIRFLNNATEKMPTWVIKGVALKSMLKKNPPKQVMKQFRFQSVDSMNKRMDPSLVVLAARALESKSWWQKQKKAMSSLSSKDFEKGEIKYVGLNDVSWLALVQDWMRIKGHSVIGVKECGIVGLWVSGEPGSYALNVPMALHVANETMLHSTFLKLHYVQPTIGAALLQAIDDGTMIRSSAYGIDFHWRDVQRYHGILGANELFVHLDIEDLGWLEVETKLALQIPELAFWIGTDFLGVSYGEKKIISMNLHDVAMSAYFGLEHNHMFTERMERSLRSELMSRYLVHDSIRALVLKQFDISGVAEENW